MYSLKCVFIVLCYLGLSFSQVAQNCTGNDFCVEWFACALVSSTLFTIPPKSCGFRGKERLVCCREDTKTRSEKYCEKIYPRITAKFIIGGKKSEKKEFPHMVALGYGSKGNIAWECGGSLISERFVLTAAHCLESPTNGLVKYTRMGTVNLKRPETGGSPQHVNVVQRIAHPQYKYPSTYHDIALLRLERNVTFSQYVQPACLNTDLRLKAQRLTASGWGFVQPEGEPSDVLMDVDLQPYTYESCRKTFPADSSRLVYGILEESQICAGGNPDEEKDTCFGDSGGPLQFIARTVFWIAGVTSFGKGCGFMGIPAVYTRVSYYANWIEDVVWPTINK